MKNFLVGLIICLVTSYSFAGARGSSDVLGDDLFPWPWGTECPFPWRDIGGEYVVLGANGAGSYNGHFINFELVSKDVDDIQFLKIQQYTRKGVKFAEGKVYSSKDQRIVRGILRTVKTGKELTIIVRSYVKDAQKSCKSTEVKNLVTAVTFCPLRGKKCLEDANYTLQKLD